MLRPILFALLIGLPVPTLGAESEAPDQAPPPTESSPAPGASPPAETATKTRVVGDENLLDATRYGLYKATEWVAREVDSWFGDRPFEQGGRVSGRIRLGTLWKEDEGFDWLTRFSVRVNLPNLRRRGGYLFLGRDNEREVVTDRPEGFTRRELLLQETRDDQSFFAGLGAQLADAVSFRAGLRGGPKPYAQARYQKIWQFADRNQIEFKETLFWTLDDGFGSTTLLVFDRLLSSTVVLRWQNAGTWTQDNIGFQWGSTLGTYWAAGLQRQLSFEALINGQTGIDVGVTEYGIRTRWEQPVYRDWLLAELIVGYFWPQTSEFSPRTSTWALGVGIQMLF